MLCYKDRTFCPFWRSCANGKGCDRALTKDIVKGSVRSNMPISRFTEKPECYRDMEKVTEPVEKNTGKRKKHEKVKARKNK